MVAAPELRETKIMENPNFDNESIVDPKDAEIERLQQQLEHAEKCDALKAEQLDQFGDAIMGVIGDKVEALADSVANREIERWPVQQSRSSLNNGGACLVRLPPVQYSIFGYHP